MEPLWRSLRTRQKTERLHPGPTRREIVGAVCGADGRYSERGVEMLLESLMIIATVLATGIEAACVPAEEGGYDYLLRVEPDLALAGTQHALTSDVPADVRDVRRVRVYLADRWPTAV